MAEPTAAAPPASENVYCRNGGEEQRLDLYLPASPGDRPGLVLCFHGGGYVEGDKRTGFELRRARLLTAFGFVVASVNYRLAPRHAFPAQLEDASCAVAFLRANATRLGIEAKWLGAMGDSAGGHLATMLALLSPSGEIGAVAAFCAPFDLENPEPGTLLAQALPPTFPTAASRRDWSPARHLTSAVPRFLLAHGKQDRFISIAQSVRFAVQLDSLVGEPMLVAVDHADHGLVPSGGAPSPVADTVDRLTIAFFLEESRRAIAD